MKKVVNGTTTVFVYNILGQLIAEYQPDPVPPPGGGGGTSYLTTDHLGSTRVVTNASGGVKARYDFLPFGEEISLSASGRTVLLGYGAADGTRQKFTQKERDSESGLDYFLARYYSAAQGRFTGCDPYSVIQDRQTHSDRDEKEERYRAYLSQPQQWNAYVYALSNPLKFVDPDGQQSLELQLLQKALSKYGPKATGYAKGLIWNAVKEVIDRGLEPIFGPNVYISPGGLGSHEIAFAKQIMDFRKESFIGVATRNEPGIDGFLMSGGTPVAAVSLTETVRDNPRVLLDLAKDKADSAGNAGFTNVDLYIKATNLSSSQVVEYVGRGPGFSNVTDKGVIKSINVFTNDGKVVQIQGQKVTVCDDKGRCQ